MYAGVAECSRRLMDLLRPWIRSDDVAGWSASVGLDSALLVADRHWVFMKTIAMEAGSKAWSRRAAAESGTPASTPDVSRWTWRAWAPASGADSHAVRVRERTEAQSATLRPQLWMVTGVHRVPPYPLIVRAWTQYW